MHPTLDTTGLDNTSSHVLCGFKIRRRNKSLYKNKTKTEYTTKTKATHITKYVNTMIN
jgi:hypothetical protein